VSSVKHPAKYSRGMTDTFRLLLHGYLQKPWKWDTPAILDPFAGVGGIHDLRPEFATFGVEIEPEWAEQSEYTFCADSTRDMPDHWTDFFQAIVTSPTYGNRMADSHTPSPEDTSTRNTYTHTLGRKLHANNSGKMQFGLDYQELHWKVYRECFRVVEPGGLMIVNTSDFIRNGKIIKVTEWHQSTLVALGFDYLTAMKVPTMRQRMGANSDLRVEGEDIMIFRKTAP